MDRFTEIKVYDGRNWFRDQMFATDWRPTPSIIDQEDEDAIIVPEYGGGENFQASQALNARL